MLNGLGSFGDFGYCDLPPDIILIEYKSGKLVCYIKSPSISEIKSFSNDLSSYVNSCKINIIDADINQYKLISYINPEEIFNIQTPPFSNSEDNISINIESTHITILV